MRSAPTTAADPARTGIGQARNRCARDSVVWSGAAPQEPARGRTARQERAISRYTCPPADLTPIISLSVPRDKRKSLQQLAKKVVIERRDGGPAELPGAFAHPRDAI